MPHWSPEDERKAPDHDGGAQDQDAGLPQRLAEELEDPAAEHRARDARTEPAISPNVVIHRAGREESPQQRVHERHLAVEEEPDGHEDEGRAPRDRHGDVDERPSRLGRR